MEQKINLTIKNPEKLFTSVFYKIYNSKKRFVVNYGGTGSSKSYSCAQSEVLKNCQTTYNTLVIRKVGNTLRDSVIPSFRKRITEFRLQEHFVYHKTDQTLINNVTGSQIIFRGLDDPERIKSFEGLQRVVIEEASELSIEDFRELNRRARGIPNIQITLNFNPIHEEHWLKKYFFDIDHDDVNIIHSTYKDNPHLTDEDREQIEKMRLFDTNQYRVYALGDWGVTKNEDPWLFAFDKTKHVKEVEFKKKYPLYLSFDFNREPVTCLIVQKSPQRGLPSSFIHFIDEIAIDAQLKDICHHIRAKYPYSILHVTGDASGNNRNVGFEQRNATYYSIIQSYLRLTKKQMHINTKNMDHSDSRQLCNIMLSEYPNIFMSPKCKTLILESELATVDTKSKTPGKLLKDRGIYKMDLFDAMRYFFQTYFKDYSKKLYFCGKLERRD